MILNLSILLMAVSGTVVFFYKRHKVYGRVERGWVKQIRIKCQNVF